MTPLKSITVDFYKYRNPSNPSCPLFALNMTRQAAQKNMRVFFFFYSIHLQQMRRARINESVPSVGVSQTLMGSVVRLTNHVVSDKRASKSKTPPPYINQK